jgi:hypothetical protein
MARIIRLIYMEATRGLGVEDDPIRVIPQLWTENGDFVAECDPHPKGGGEPKSVFYPGSLKAV